VPQSVLVRHSYFGHETFSKRARPSDDTAILQRTGRERAILELQGVLFFGNGDALSNIVDDILKEAKMVLLDLGGISDVDVSGASILANLMERAHARGKKILLCNLQGTDLARSSRQKLPNVDSGLQWMEDQALRAAGTRTPTRAIALEAHELTQKLNLGEFAIFAAVLIRPDFERGTVIRREGEDGHPLRGAPRTTPYERLSRIRRPPRVSDGKALVGPRMKDAGRREEGAGQRGHPVPSRAIPLATSTERTTP
jgi:sulfate permease, SulP family